MFVFPLSPFDTSSPDSPLSAPNKTKFPINLVQFLSVVAPIGKLWGVPSQARRSATARPVQQDVLFAARQPLLNETLLHVTPISTPHAVDDIPDRSERLACISGKQGDDRVVPVKLFNLRRLHCLLGSLPSGFLRART